MENLVAYSLVAVYSAMGVYTIAFILFTLDLAKRSAATGRTSGQAAAPAAASTTASAAQGGSAASIGSRGTAVLDRPVVSAREKDAGTGGTRYQKAAFALTLLAFVLHMGAVVTRGLAAERVPWSNMFEFGLTATAMAVMTFLLVQIWRDVRFLGAYITGFALLALGVVTVNFYVDVVPTPPALQSAWLVIHVLVASLATGFFAIGAGLSIMQLLRSRAAASKAEGLSFVRTLPGASTLESLAYRVNVVGFVFWTFTLIAGAIWAERAWGRYWGWDTKEVWTFIIWVLFAGYIHARATRGWRGTRSAWLAIIGFSAVLFNYGVVNIFFKGLHAYSGLTE
ncbi:c-type cytochrome biogenesis protein CcsB [Microcella daejeonensis]|uniref:C-type cytochrome biogenesis protein CcsB n=1 Tax=Microcella daejeonensis TaxID=2994971 RepID=A0A9E8MM57_9MICO|nr:c-type cytochrome biogenesis protein CcsB [Microcella daejeonensis]WAB82077.1 c-type cytochrome biogenesis protein CcsB [Microcella daejeonensis]